MWQYLAVDAVCPRESYDCVCMVFMSSRPNIHSLVGAVTCWHLMLTAELPCAQGYGIPLQYRGSVNNASTGAHRANLSPAIKTLGTEIATDELHHVAFLRTALGASAPDKPAVCAWTVLIVQGPLYLSAAQLTSLLSRCDRSLPVYRVTGQPPSVPQVQVPNASVMNRHVKTRRTARISDPLCTVHCRSTSPPSARQPQRRST